jgi:hypothetical protein
MAKTNIKNFKLDGYHELNRWKEITEACGDDDVSRCPIP